MVKASDVQQKYEEYKEEFGKVMTGIAEKACQEMARSGDDFKVHLSQLQYGVNLGMRVDLPEV